MISELSIWAAQDALMELLVAHEALDHGGAAEVALDLGFPATIAEQHVWLMGDVDGSLTFDLTGAKPSEDVFRFKVFVFAVADDYLAVREKVIALAAAVEDCLSSEDFAAVVPVWSVPTYRGESGTDGTRRQLCLEFTVECRCW